MDDSDLNVSGMSNNSSRVSIRNMKRYQNDSNILNLSSQSSQLSSSLQFSQSSISARGYMNNLNDTQESMGLPWLLGNQQDPNDKSSFQQEYIIDRNWLRKSEQITEKLEKNIYETQEKKDTILDNQDVFLLPDEFMKPDHEVRAIQDEIFQKSVDKNSIFMIETDSGKLTITMMHILHRLKNYQNKKVVFLCPLIDSVKQQATLIKAIISRLYNQEEYSALLMELQPKVLVLHGEKGDDAWNLLERFQRSIIITTPQYFLNGLRRQYIKLEDFSLVIFDECHHCLKSHPYNMILQESYYCMDDSQEKPQILGILSSKTPMTFGYKKEEIRLKLTEVCKNLDAKFCTLDGKQTETKLDAWTFVNDAELDALDILGLAEQRKLTSKFDKIRFLEVWNNALNKIFNTIKWETLRTGMKTKDYFRSKVLNKAIALSLEIGSYAVYLYFTDVCEELPKKYKELNEIEEILSGFLKSIEGYNDKGKISGKCKLFMENLGRLVQGDQKGIVFVEKKYMGRILNKIINNHNSRVKSCIEKTKISECNILISTSLKQQEIEALEVKFAISFHEPKTTLAILQIRNSLPTYNILLSKNTAENRLKAYEFGLSLQSIMKEKGFTEKSNENKQQHPKDSPIEMSKTYQGLNTNWADWLSKIYCKSLPGNSTDINKSFYLMLQQMIHGKPLFTCIMLLPSQSNIRIVLGRTYPIKNDAKRSAALECCEKLIELSHFDKHLNPKSLNKSLVEFATLQTEPFECQEDFEDLESTTEDLHHISHFAKSFELKGKVYKGFLYEIWVSNESTEDKIGFVHYSKDLDKWNPPDSGLNFRILGKIDFTLKEYQDYLLIHRYLAAMIKSKPSSLLQFLNILTQDPPNFYKFEEKQLDPDYELWISRTPCLSFFIILDNEYEIAKDFVTKMKHYIEYQCQVYQYINSISLESTEYEPLWDLPKPKEKFIENENYVIQDVWRFDRHKLSEMKDLLEIDYYEGKDLPSESLQKRQIFLVDPFLRNLEDEKEDKDGFAVEKMEKKESEKDPTYLEDELMLSPVSVNLYQILKDIFVRFEKIKQEDLSWKLYENMLKGYEKEKIQKEKEYSVNTENLDDIFEIFDEQFVSDRSFYQPYRGPEKKTNQSMSMNQSLFDAEIDLNEGGAEGGLNEKLKQLFIVEKFTTKKDKTLLGEKLVEMLMHIDIFVNHKDEWDYSLEKIKRERIKKLKKKENEVLGKIQGLFISSNGNILFSNPIITRDELEPYRFSAEYVAKANLGKIVKTTALYLSEKNLGQVQKFLLKIGLLEHGSVKIKQEEALNYQPLNALEGFYTRFEGLENVIGYEFKNKKLLVQAFMELSLRDYYVEWTEKLAPLLQRTSLFGLKEKVFQNNGEECPVEVPPLDIENLFPCQVPGAINHYHSNVNEMDRLRWLGEGLVQYYIIKWADDQFAKRRSREIKARYLIEERFITAVSWEYNLEDCLIAHHNCFNQLKLLKEKMPPKELLRKSLDEQTRRLCYISASLFYSLIAAIFLDSQGDFVTVEKVILELIPPVAKKHFRNRFVVEYYAVDKLEKYCKELELGKPVIKKSAVEEKESFTSPASSKYELFIGGDKYSSLVSTSLKKVEYTLYVLACEKLGL